MIILFSLTNWLLAFVRERNFSKAVQHYPVPLENIRSTGKTPWMTRALGRYGTCSYRKECNRHEMNMLVTIYPQELLQFYDIR